MRIFWERISNNSDDYTEARKIARVMDSKISNPNINIEVGDGGEVFIYPTEYDITGLSLSLEDLEIIISEARARKKNQLPPES